MSGMEAFVEAFEKKNQDMERHEKETRQRLQNLERTLPSLMMWNMWRTLMCMQQNGGRPPPQRMAHQIPPFDSRYPTQLPPQNTQLPQKLSDSSLRPLEDRLKKMEERLLADNEELLKSRRIEEELKRKVESLEGVVYEKERNILDMLKRDPKEDAEAFEKLNYMADKRDEMNKRLKSWGFEPQEKSPEDTFAEADAPLAKNKRPGTPGGLSGSINIDLSTVPQVVDLLSQLPLGLDIFGALEMPQGIAFFGSGGGLPPGGQLFGGTSPSPGYRGPCSDRMYPGHQPTYGSRDINCEEILKMFDLTHTPQTITPQTMTPQMMTTQATTPCLQISQKDISLTEKLKLLENEVNKIHGNLKLRQSERLQLQEEEKTLNEQLDSCLQKLTKLKSTKAAGGPENVKLIKPEIPFGKPLSMPEARESSDENVTSKKQEPQTKRTASFSVSGSRAEISPNEEARYKAWNWEYQGMMKTSKRRTSVEEEARCRAWNQQWSGSSKNEAERKVQESQEAIQTLTVGSEQISIARLKSWNCLDQETPAKRMSDPKANSKISTLCEELQIIIRERGLEKISQALLGGLKAKKKPTGMPDDEWSTLFDKIEAAIRAKPGTVEEVLNCWESLEKPEDPTDQLKEAVQQVPKQLTQLVQNWKTLDKPSNLSEGEWAKMNANLQAAAKEGTEIAKELLDDYNEPDILKGLPTLSRLKIAMKAGPEKTSQLLEYWKGIEKHPSMSRANWAVISAKVAKAAGGEPKDMEELIDFWENLERPYSARTRTSSNKDLTGPTEFPIIEHQSQIFNHSIIEVGILHSLIFLLLTYVAMKH